MVGCSHHGTSFGCFGPTIHGVSFQAEDAWLTNFLNTEIGPLSLSSSLVSCPSSYSRSLQLIEVYPSL